MCRNNETLMKPCGRIFLIDHTAANTKLNKLPGVEKNVSSFHTHPVFWLFMMTVVTWIGKCFLVGVLELPIVNSTDNRSNISILLCILHQSRLNSFTVQPTCWNQRAHMTYQFTMEIFSPSADVTDCATGSHLTLAFQHYLQWRCLSACSV